MFFIGKAAHFLLLPPGILILCFCAGILLLLVKKRKAGIAVIGAGVYFLYILSTDVVRDRLLIPLECKYPPWRGPAGEADSAPGCIVVLGGGTIAVSPEEGGLGSLGAEALKRLMYAYRLHKQLGIPVVVTGGNVYDLPNVEPEAVVAARYLGSLGVEPSFIIRDDKSRTTKENAEKVKDLAVRTPVLLVTSAYHMPRSVQSFRAVNLDIIPAPCDYKVQYVPYTFMSFLPGASNFDASVKAIKEYLGLVFYRLMMRDRRSA